MPWILKDERIVNYIYTIIDLIIIGYLKIQEEKSMIFREFKT